MELFAWIGEDEFGSGRIGLKQGRVPAGMIPLVVMDYDRAKIERLKQDLQKQADYYGVTIRLARFAFVDDVLTLQPNGGRK